MQRIARSSTLLAIAVCVTLAFHGTVGAADVQPVSKPVDLKSPGSGVVAYYFHGNFRCPTCLAIERLARETVVADFPAEVASGQLRWFAVNMEEAGNEHFADDFQLTTRSLVLVSYQDNRVVRFQVLDKVWQLVRDDIAFADHVREATAAFLAAG